MRCDLHVHTIHSGMCNVPVINRICRESYNDPHELYATLKARGMDLVTVTDHDSIDAIEPLRRHADFFLSEEVSCRMPSGTHLHIGVYGIEERDHIELQRRRDDMPSLLAYLDEHRLLYSINHVFSGLTGARKMEDFATFATRFPAAETRNGQMLGIANRSAAEFAANHGRIGIAGSDAHTMASVGRTYTEVLQARDAREFLLGLRAGQGRVEGVSGDYWKLTLAIWEIGISLMREHRATILMAPLMALIPAITLVNYGMEYAFAATWGRRVGKNFHITRRDGIPVPSVISLS